MVRWWAQSKRGASNLLLLSYCTSSPPTLKLQTQTLDSVDLPFPKSPLHYSFSTSQASLHNHYLRKRRRWPIPPYPTKWLPDFALQKALDTLKEKAKCSKTNLLHDLIDAFAAYKCEPSPDAYHFVLRTLFCSPRTWDQVPHLLHHMQTGAAFETPEEIFVDLINFYCHDGGNVQQAIELFFRIPNFRCNPSARSLNALLTVLCDKKWCLPIVPQILIKSQLMSIRLEVSSFRILIRAMCEFGNVKVAVQLFNYMVTEAFALDYTIASLILRAMCEEQESNGAEIMRFLEDARRLGFTLDKGVWCTVIGSLVKKGSGEDAMEALTQMRSDGVQADIVCYNLVLDKLVSDENYVSVDQLFDQMLVLGLIPDIFTYNSYINCMCKQNKVEDGIKMLSCMEELGCRPNLTTYDMILKSLLAAGKLNLAREVLMKMESRGVQLNLEKYEIVSGGFSK